MSKKFNHYIGKAGHLYAMSEFLMRGWNVAIPEVDIGDDIFVVQDSNGLLKRVQVKTATSRERGIRFSGAFFISFKNLENLSDSLVYYVFIIRHQDEWTKPVIIRQDYLLSHIRSGGTAIAQRKNVSLYLSYRNKNVSCSGRDFTKYIGNFEDFPVIEH